MGSKENSPLRMSYGQPVKDQPVSRILVGGPAAVLGNPIPSYMNHGGTQGLHQVTYGGLGNASATQISTTHLHGGYGGGSSTGLPGFGHVPTTSTYGNTTHLGSTMNRTTEYSQTAYGGTPSSTINFHNLNHENNDLTTKESALLKKIEELEKENKMLQGLVKRTEKQITDITKMAQEEERKIFSLLIEVINQKNIKIDYADIEANYRPDPSQLDATQNLSRLDNEEVNAEETNHLLMEHLALAADEHKGDLPYTLLALMRRSVLSDKSNK